MKRIILLFCLIALFELGAQDPVVLLTFQQLTSVPDAQQLVAGDQLPEQIKEIHGRVVSMRGFLYKSADGRLVLAAEPDLKSCCVGSAMRLARQIEVEGVVSRVADGSAAMTLQGRFFVSPVRNSDGGWRRYYVLEDAILSEGQRGDMSAFLISASLLVVAAWGVYYFLSKKRG